MGNKEAIKRGDVQFTSAGNQGGRRGAKGEESRGRGEEGARYILLQLVFLIFKF
jgi:hypothetical protein